MPSTLSNRTLIVLGWIQLDGKDRRALNAALDPRSRASGWTCYSTPSSMVYSAAGDAIESACVVLTGKYPGRDLDSRISWCSRWRRTKRSYRWQESAEDSCDESLRLIREHIPSMSGAVLDEAVRLYRVSTPDARRRARKALYGARARASLSPAQRRAKRLAYALRRGAGEREIPGIVMGDLVESSHGGGDGE